MEDNLKEFNPMEEKKLPSGLNVLTILTFIGSGLGLLGTVYNYAMAKTNLEKMHELVNSDAYEKMPDFAKNMMGPDPVATAQKTFDNRLPMAAIGLIGIVLCVYGAIQMRKLKMDGYYLYLAGEILPIIGMVIFLGTSSITGVSGAFIIGLTLLFVILYTVQRKYFTK